MRVERDFAGIRLRGSREYQQDYYAFCPTEPKDREEPGLVLAVADGAGGMESGGTASKIAVEGFMQTYFSSKLRNGERLREAMEAANRQVSEICEVAPQTWEDASVATTLIGLHVTPVYFEWVSAGDSLLLHIEAGKLVRRNEDHSFRQNGTMGNANNALFSALTGAPIPVIDEQQFQWSEGDWLLAASDGILTLSDDEIERVFSVAGITANQVVETLAGIIHKRAFPKQDNVTIAVVKHVGRTDWVG